MSSLAQASTPLVQGREKTKFDTKTLMALAMLTGLAYFVTFLSNFIPLKVAGFLEFDFKDTVIMIGGFLYGPMAALLMTVAVSLIQFVTISSTGVVGLAMNLIATGSFCCTASLIYWHRSTLKGALLGLSLGGVVMTVLMILWNYAITPLYMQVPRDVVVGMLIPVFLPFNLVKAGLNMGAILLLFPPVERALQRAHLVPQVNKEESGKKSLLTAMGVLALFVVMALTISEIV